MSYENCRNCGYPEGLHHYETMQCPKGGESPVGKKQEWLNTVYLPDVKGLVINANDEQLMAAAEVLKRIGYTDIRKLSASDKEAYDAQYALEKIRQSLAEQGYNPR